MPTALLALVMNPCHYRHTEETGPEYMTRTQQLQKCKAKCFDFANCWDAEKFSTLFKKERRELIHQEFNKLLKKNKK